MGPEQRKAASKLLSDGVLIESGGSVRLREWYIFPRIVSGRGQQTEIEALENVAARSHASSEVACKQRGRMQVARLHASSEVTCR